MLEGGPLPSLLRLREGRLPQRPKGRLAFLDKGKELLTPLLSSLSAVFPLKSVTDVRQRLWMAAPEAAQDKRRKTHGSIESCHERWELLKEELARAESSKPLSEQAEGVQGASQPHRGPNTGQTGKEDPATGATGHPHTTWADVAKAKSDEGSDKNAQQAGKASPSPEVPVKDGDTNTQDSQVAHYERALAALPEGCSLRDNLKTQMMALKVTLPPEPGVRVDQATARLTRAQKLKAEPEEKLLEVEQAVQDNLMEIAAATTELENAKHTLIPSAPSIDSGSACITFSREQSAELQGFLLSCQKSMATDPEEKERAKRRCNESHEAAGVTQEAAQEEVDIVTS